MTRDEIDKIVRQAKAWAVLDGPVAEDVINTLADIIRALRAAPTPPASDEKHRKATAEKLRAVLARYNLLDPIHGLGRDVDEAIRWALGAVAEPTPTMAAPTPPNGERIETGPQPTACGGAAAMPISGPERPGESVQYLPNGQGMPEDVTAGETALLLRRFLWVNHGCPVGVLYGGDGEMQCNNRSAHAPIDFKREGLTSLVEVVVACLKSPPPTPPAAPPSDLVALVQVVRVAYRNKHAASVWDTVAQAIADRRLDDAIDALLAWTPAAPPAPETREQQEIAALRHALWNIAGTIVAVVDDPNEARGRHARSVGLSETSPLVDEARDAIRRFNLSNETAALAGETPAGSDQ